MLLCTRERAIKVCSLYGLRLLICCTYQITRIRRVRTRPSPITLDQLSGMGRGSAAIPKPRWRPRKCSRIRHPGGTNSIRSTEPAPRESRMPRALSPALKRYRSSGVRPSRRGSTNRSRLVLASLCEREITTRTDGSAGRTRSLRKETHESMVIVRALDLPTAGQVSSSALTEPLA